MAKRLSATEKWDKVWFRKLKPKHKCFWEYLRDKCNFIGLWEIDFEAASFHIGEELKESEVIEIFKDKIELIGNKIFLKDFVNFQYGTELKSSSPMHSKVIKELERKGLSDRFIVVNKGVEDHFKVRQRLSTKHKNRIKLRDNCQCQYCGETKGTDDLEIDHFIPTVLGGLNNDENLITSCRRCNAKKRDSHPLDFVKKYEIYPLNRVFNLLNTLKEKEEEEEREVINKEDKNDKEEEEEVEIYPSFTDFWDLYNKKVGKKEKIKKKWEKLPQKTKETIIEYIPFYINSQPEKKYRKNPETFLNNESWKDEIINNQSNEQQINQSTTGASPEFRRKTAERVGVTKPE